MALKELTTSNFDEEVKNGVTLVDLWAPWCGPCRMLTPTIEALSEEMDNVKFTKLDIDENPEIAERYNILSIPTLIFIKDGEEKDQINGVVPKNLIKQKLEELL